MPRAQTRPDAGFLSIEPFEGSVKVTFSDAILASTDRAKILRESGKDPVFYIPFEDVYFEFLQKSAATSRCPVKGQANYWRASAVGNAAEEAMWAYLTPNPAASALAGHGAFDERKVAIEATPAPDREHTPRFVE